MKAQARKILALIMAMVMCLSLAAPAFAASEEAPEAPEASTSEVVETEAPETEEKGEKKASLKKQEAPASYEVVPYTDGTGRFTVVKKETVEGNTTTTTLIAGNVTDEKQNAAITVDYVAKSGVIGGTKYAAYTVKYEYSDGKYTDAVTVKVGEDVGGTKSFQDVSPWVDLEEGQTVKIGSAYYLVDGTVYQEKQLDGSGLYVPYFQLFLADTTKKSFKTDETPLYFKGPAGNELKTANDFSTALASAKQCDIYGKTDASGMGGNIVDAHVVLETTPVANTYTANSFTVINPSKDLEVSKTNDAFTPASGTPTGVTEGTITVNFASGTEETTGSFQVAILATTREDKKEDVTAYVTDAAEAQKILAKRWDAENNAKLESVEAATGNYVTVKVSKAVASDKLEISDALYGKNIAALVDDKLGELKTNSSGFTAVLIDLSQDGWYNGTSLKGANAVAVPAGTETLGPVIVRASELGTKVKPGTEATAKSENSYYVYSSVEAMQKSIYAEDCTAAKTINYVQIVLNPWNGSKQNKLVTKVANTVTAVKKMDNAFKQNDVQIFGLVSDYYEQAYNTPNADFVKKGTFDVQAKEHGKKITTKEVTKAPTCQEKGVLTIKTVCETCKKVLETKTEEIAVDSNPVEKKTGAGVDQETNPKSISFEEGEGHTSSHWIKKAETTTTTNPTTGEITATTTYTCNYGHVHTELNYVKTTKKADLQYSGRWDFFTLDKFTALDEISGAHSALGLVKSVTVVDSDVELTSFPMNRAEDKKFEFDVRSFATSTDVNGNFYEQRDGNLYGYSALDEGIPVYASATALPTTKYYAAMLTITDIVPRVNSCEDASCTVKVDVYEVDKSLATAVSELTVKAKCMDAIYDATVLENNLKNKKVTLVKSYSDKVVIKGNGHQFFNSLGQATELCTVCGTKKPAESTVAKPIDAANVTVKNLTYTGNVAQPKVKVVDADGFTLIKGTDYVVSETDEVNVGEYPITVKGINEYAGNKFKLTFKITQAKQPMTVKATAPSAKKLKKKAQKVGLTIKKAQGEVTVKVSGPATVKGTTVKAKKGTKKGKKIKITVTAAGNDNYMSGSVTKTVKVKA